MRAIRNVAKAKYNTHSEPLFKSLKILKVEDLFKLSCTKIYYKFHNKLLPDYFTSFPFKHTDTDIHDTERRPRRNLILTECYQQGKANLPNLRPTIQTTATNRINSRNCIRHFIPKLINDKYLPDISISKTHTLAKGVQFIC